MPEPCTQPNPWVTSVRPCVRSLGHAGPHRDSIGGRWVTGQELGQAWGAGPVGLAPSGLGPTTPLTPQALATPHPPPPSTRERELEAQLDQERRDHALTRFTLETVLRRLADHHQGSTPEGDTPGGPRG
jgi:hypothetical protein